MVVRVLREVSARLVLRVLREHKAVWVRSQVASSLMEVREARVQMVLMAAAGAGGAVAAVQVSILMAPAAVVGAVAA